MTPRSYSTYSDLNENPTSDRDILVKDEDSVNQAISNLLEIVKGERLFNNNGLDPDAELFELGSDGDAEELFNDLIQEIENNEPRIQLNLSKSQIVPNYDNNRYTIELYFTLNGISTTERQYIRSL